MQTALDRAFADSQRSYHAAKAAVASASPGDILATSRSGLPMGERTSTAGAAQQLAAFRGWPFACIHALASRIAGQQIHVGIQRPEVTARGPLPRRELFDSPLLTLLNDPNDLQIAWSLWYFTVASLELTGKCLWWRVEIDKRDQLLPIPTSWLTGMQGSTRFEAFTIRPPGDAEEYSIDADDAVYFFYPSPTGLRDSVSPLQAAAYAVDTDDQIQRSQLAAFHNGIFPKHAIIVGKNAGPDGSVNTGTRPRLTGPQRRQLIRAVLDLYRGSVRDGSPIILDGLVEDIKRLSLGPAEMDWTESGKSVKARITQIFGVNPIVLGEIESANRASSLAAEEHLASTINPKLRLLAGTLNEWLCPHYPAQAGKLVCWFDEYTPRDAEMELRRMQLLGQFGAVTPDELREWAGLPPLPGGLGGLPLTPPLGVETALERMIDASSMTWGRLIANDVVDRRERAKSNGHAHG
jgi:phage portal protein BeeE